MVIWIIGISGAGKSTLAREVYRRAREHTPAVVMLDGDQVREAFGNDLTHSVKDRYENSRRISQLCRLLSNQDIHVICPILSIFPESRQWNRQHVPGYYEVSIRCSLADVEARDTKGLYAKARRGELKDVVGIDIPYIEPTEADLVIDNNNKLSHLLSYAPRLSGFMSQDSALAAAEQSAQATFRAIESGTNNEQ